MARFYQAHLDVKGEGLRGVGLERKVRKGQPLSLSHVGLCSPALVGGPKLLLLARSDVDPASVMMAKCAGLGAACPVIRGNCGWSCISVLSDPPLPGARQLAARDPEAILEAVCDHFGLVRSALACRGDPHIARAAAAWLCRQHCEIALHELAPMLGLSQADSVPNLTRRIDAHLRSHPRLADDLKEIMARIGRETKNKV